MKTKFLKTGILFILTILMSTATYAYSDSGQDETHGLIINKIEYTKFSTSRTTSTISNTDCFQKGRYVFIMYVVKSNSNDKVYTFITPVFYSSESERTLQSDFKTWFRANHRGYDERFDPIVDWSYNNPQSESDALRKRDKIIGKKDSSAIKYANFTGY